MRPLTGRQAVQCENATTQRCICRCNGACHGIRRSELREYFEQLDSEDPHWLPERSRQLPLPPPVGLAEAFARAKQLLRLVQQAQA